MTPEQVELILMYWSPTMKVGHEYMKKMKKKKYRKPIRLEALSVLFHIVCNNHTLLYKENPQEFKSYIQNVVRASLERWMTTLTPSPSERSDHVEA